MVIKIYRAVYQGAAGTYLERTNLSFHRWVTADDMEAAKEELRAVLDEGAPRIIIGWEEMELEADEPE